MIRRAFRILTVLAFIAICLAAVAIVVQSVMNR